MATRSGVHRDLTRQFMSLRVACRARRVAMPAWARMGSRDGYERVPTEEDQEASTAVVDLTVLPPEWLEEIENVKLSLVPIQEKIKALAALHDKFVNRPGFDDGVEAELVIEQLTHEVTAALRQAQQKLVAVRRVGGLKTSAEDAMCKNAQSSLALEMQKLSNEFKRSQSNYLERMRARQRLEASSMAPNPYEVEAQADAAMDSYLQGQIAVQQSTEFVDQRNREINEIVRSIQDLARIFEDLAQLVIDQGTVLDRIDYNIETTFHSVEQGRTELVQADNYQKKSIKRKLILILIVLVIAFAFAILAKLM